MDSISIAHPAATRKACKGAWQCSHSLWLIARQMGMAASLEGILHGFVEVM